MQKNTTQKSPSAAVITAGIAALAAAGYFVFGPNGKNNRKQIKGWTLKMKGDVLERMEKLKDVTPEIYAGIIDDVSKKYGKLKNISAGEITEIAMDMKKHWNAIARDIKAGQAAAQRSRGGAKKKAAAANGAAKKKSAPKKAAKKATE